MEKVGERDGRKREDDALRAARHIELASGIVSAPDAGFPFALMDSLLSVRYGLRM